MKKRRAEKRAEEERIIAEMEEALREQKALKEAEQAQAFEKNSTANPDGKGDKALETNAGENADDMPTDETEQGETESLARVEILHCRKCKTTMENGVCPACGYRDYQPLDAKTQKILRMVLGGICILGFLILVIIKNMK